MAHLIDTHDWSASPIGAPDTWPVEFQTLVKLMLDSQVPMWAAWGPSLGMVYNTPYVEMLGDKHPASLGSPLQAVWQEIWHVVSGLVETTLSGQSIYQEDLPLVINRYGRNEQTWFTFSYSPIREGGGAVRGLICTVWESTEKMLGQQRLAASEARLRALTTASSNAMYRMSADWSEMLELNGQGFIEDTKQPSRAWLDSYIEPADLPIVHEAIERAIRTKSMFELEHRVIRTDGTLGWTQSRAVPMLDGAGEITEWFGTASDVTARKEAETQLVEADRMKDQFLATLAHELRNPLAPIRNGLQLLKLGEARPQAADVLGMMDRQVTHLVRLVDDLMEVARISTGALQLRHAHIDLANTLKSAFDLSRPAIEKGRHTLQIRFPSEALWVDGDEVRLAQVFSNLINNAAKYTSTPGLIEVSMHREGEQAVVEVRDNGIGIAQADQGRLFALFGRLDTSAARGDGLGVGLALARRLLDLHGGTIGVTSAGVGAGSCFTVTLPLAKPYRQPAKPPASNDAASCEGLKVLIVDDNRDAAESLAALIDLSGAQTHVFHSGLAALDALDAIEPALALLDIGMPEIDGHQMARAIRARERHRDMLIVAVTGWGQPEDRERTREAGFDEHLVKPVEHELIERVLRRAMKYGQTRGN